MTHSPPPTPWSSLSINYAGLSPSNSLLSSSRLHYYPSPSSVSSPSYPYPLDFHLPYIPWLPFPNTNYNDLTIWLACLRYRLDQSRCGQSSRTSTPSKSARQKLSVFARSTLIVFRYVDTFPSDYSILSQYSYPSCARGCSSHRLFIHWLNFLPCR